jgi:hypothetical protein
LLKSRAVFCWLHLDTPSGSALEQVRKFALDFEYYTFDLGTYIRLRSLTQIEEPIFVIADSTVGSRRRIGKSRASLGLLQEDYCRPGQTFPFRFMFSDISDPLQGSFEYKLKEYGKLSHKSLFQD